MKTSLPLDASRTGGRRLLTATLLAWASVAAAPAGARAEGGAAAPPVAATAPADAIADAFGQLETDPPPGSLTRDSHYVVSNENHLTLFAEALEGRGGVFVGVGTDQNYLMAGWARPEVLVLLDFDQVVVDLHGVYRIFFDVAETPDGLLEAWTREAEPKMRALLEERFEGGALKRAQKAYKLGRKWIDRRLHRLQKRFQRANLATFLTDQAQYDYVRRLYARGRVFAVRGDLTQDRALQSVGRAARAAGLPVRALYLSNAEQYFKYGDQYRKNILDLPTDDRSIIVRTMPDGEKAYYYLVQTAANFRAWLESPTTRSVFTMYRHRQADGHERRFKIAKLPTGRTRQAANE